MLQLKVLFFEFRRWGTRAVRVCGRTITDWRDVGKTMHQHFSICNNNIYKFIKLILYDVHRCGQNN